MEQFIFSQSFFLALIVGIASGAVGSFIILKRMALVGDALSHVALPGIALALLYQFDPFWGVLVFLFGAAFLVWWLEGKTKLPTEALVGLLFTTSLAVGALFIPDTEILESLFGSFQKLPPFEFLFILGAAVLATLLLLAYAKRFLFSIISPELSQLNDRKRYFDLFLFLLFSAIVAMGIKLVGTLLMGTLTIIPASIAKNMNKSMRGYIIASVLIGGGMSAVGVLISGYFDFLPGPTIVLLGVFLFLCSLLLAKR